MLTDAQFYLRILEEIIKEHGSLCLDSVRESEDLAEYLEKRLGVKHSDEDDGESELKAGEQIELTLRGFIQALGKRSGIDLKFA